MENTEAIIRDARLVRKGDTLVDRVTDLLDSAEDLIRIDRVLMDREFDSQHALSLTVPGDEIQLCLADSCCGRN